MTRKTKISGQWSFTALVEGEETRALGPELVVGGAMSDVISTGPPLILVFPPLLSLRRLCGPALARTIHDELVVYNTLANTPTTDITDPKFNAWLNQQDPRYTQARSQCQALSNDLGIVIENVNASASEIKQSSAGTQKTSNIALTCSEGYPVAYLGKRIARKDARTLLKGPFNHAKDPVLRPFLLQWKARSPEILSLIAIWAGGTPGDMFLDLAVLKLRCPPRAGRRFALTAAVLLEAELLLAEEVEEARLGWEGNGEGWWDGGTKIRRGITRARVGGDEDHQWPFEGIKACRLRSARKAAASGSSMTHFDTIGALVLRSGTLRANCDAICD
ncbi:hypothetical protein B0H19DRAFT_1241032 [Mycena capillaripes]|nr:hypothetical protein B0H19DRAFT_1241032 [Mycena capillaripes]